MAGVLYGNGCGDFHFNAAKHLPPGCYGGERMNCPTLNLALGLRLLRGNRRRAQPVSTVLALKTRKQIAQRFNQQTWRASVRLKRLLAAQSLFHPTKETMP